MTDRAARRARAHYLARRNASRRERPALLRTFSDVLGRRIGGDDLLSLEESDALAGLVEWHEAGLGAVGGPGPQVLAVTTASQPVASAFVERALAEVGDRPTAVLTHKVYLLGAPVLRSGVGSGEVLRLLLNYQPVSICTTEGDVGMTVDRDTFSDHLPPMWNVTAWGATDWAGPLPYPALTTEERAAGFAAFSAWWR